MATITTFSLALILALVSLALIDAESNSFSIELIHRDSPKSPMYNPDESKPERVANAVRRSISRARLLEHKLRISSSSNGSQSFAPLDEQAPVTANNGAYLVHVSLGTPKFSIVAIADTGSDIIWTQCKPCTDCYQQTAPLFNPKSSSTYRTISCSSTTCTSLGRADTTSCSGDGDVCQYQVSYGDQSYTRGDVATDTLTLDSTTGRKVALPRTVIGCSHESQGTFSPNGSGIVGLGGGPASLVSQLGSGKFAYCLAPFGDDTPSTLTFGQSGTVSGGVSTPLISDPTTPTFYFLRLEAISVGTKRIPLPAGSSSSSSSSKGNIIIDSGTTLTLVPTGVLSQLADAVSSQVSGGTPVQVEDLETCYRAEDSGSFETPKLTMHFDGADVELETANTFIELQENVLCFAFAGSDELSIYGNVAQQNFKVGYDLKGKTLSFKPTDCTGSSSS